MVSVIICTRDKDPETNIRLKECLDSISKQTYLKHDSIRVFVRGGNSIREARKEGIEDALKNFGHSRYICFIDDDQILPPTLIQNCIESGYDAVTWIERALDPKTFCEKVIDYDKQLFHQAQDDDPIKGAAEPRFFKAEYIKRLDWNELPPVTFELAMINKQVNDMGCEVGWVDSVVYHHEPHTFRELAKKFFRYGYYYIPSLKCSKELVLNHSKPRRVYFSFSAISHPALYVGLWFHYFIKAISATGGAIWYLIKEP